MSLDQVDVMASKSAVTSPQANRAGPLTALPTSSAPQPKTLSTPGWPRSVAVDNNVCRTMSLSKYGNACHTSAAAPDTSGAANEVPLTTYAFQPASPW